MTEHNPPVGDAPSEVAPPGAVAEQAPVVTDAPSGSEDTDPSRNPPYTHTRLSGYWAAIVVGLVVLLILIVFILENSQKVKISFFGAHAQLAEGVALLLAAVIGGLVVVFAGMARILQLRARAHRTAKAAGLSRRAQRRSRRAR